MNSSPEMTTNGIVPAMGDIELLTNALRSRFPSSPQQTDSGWGKPALNVLDCVLSVNRNYDKLVLPRLEDYAHKRPGVCTLVDLHTVISSHPSPADFLTAELRYNDPQRASILQEVTSYLRDIQHDFDGSTENERLRAWAEWAHPGDFAFTGVRGFALSGFQYLRLLFGANTAKPDIAVCRFVSDCVVRQVSPAEALFLLERAAKRANLCIRDINSAIGNQGAKRMKAVAVMRAGAS
jgi:hypothetical protein